MRTSWALATFGLLLATLIAAAVPAGFFARDSSAPPAAVGAHGSAGLGLASLPLQAQGAISASLETTNSSAYRITASVGGAQGLNPAQGMRLRFDRSGVSVRGPSAAVDLELRAVGYGAALHPIAPVAPRARGDRVVYRHPGLREWYANGPLGLEQGFTVYRAPAVPRVGPLTLEIAISGDAHASLVGETVTLTRDGVSRFSYGGLTTADSKGRALRAWLSLRNDQLLIHVDARRASYPLRIDPFLQQGEKLVGPERFSGFGVRVALSSDGTTALVGSDGTSEGLGSARVFTRTGGVWTQQGPALTGEGEVGRGNFGEYVALSADGNTALISGPRDSGNVGAAWVFTRSGGVWTQQGKELTGAGEVGKGVFGWGVALSADGNTALIGAPEDNEEGTTGGAAWVFTRSGGVWTQQGSKLTGSGASVDADFGIAVALSGDGNTALIGGFQDGEGEKAGTGAAWAFTRSSGVWTQQGSKLTARDEVGKGFFGTDVALSADGNTALIGGPEDINSAFTGAAWAFERTSGVWNQQGSKFVGFGGTGGSRFGYGVALSSDGNTALIGGTFDNESTGAAWLYQRIGQSWGQLGKKFTGSGAVGKGQFGFSVALSSDANTALISGPEDGSESQGAVWPFVLPPEYGRCKKVTAGTGKFENSGCTKLGGTKQYEWFPAFGGAAPLVKTTFTTKIKELTELKLETTSAATIACTGETSIGQYTGNRSIGNVVLTLSGCHREALGKCQSAGAKEGEIVTKALEGHLGVIKTSTEGLIKNIVGTELAAPGLGTVAEFSCAGTAVKLLEGVIVPVKANSMVASETLKFVESKGVQKPHQFSEYPFGELLGMKFGEEIFPKETGLSLTTRLTNAEKVEVNSTL